MAEPPGATGGRSCVPPGGRAVLDKRRPPLGCIANYTGRDIRSDAVVFYSSCDPFGTNPYGGQIFAMHPDGTGLRQLTTTQGYTRDESGAITVELPFPFAYPGYVLRNQTN